MKQSAKQAGAQGAARPFFTPEALKFLSGLARNNNREWFEARRDVYERELKAPMHALVEAINAELAEFAPDHVRPPHKAMLRIYRDTRFSADKRPYKKHVAAWFGRHGAVRTSGAGFYLDILPAGVHLGIGIFMPTPEQLLLIRRWLVEHHEEFRKLLKQATRKRANGLALEPVDVQALARMPKGFPADHPAGELLRARRWGVQCSWPAVAAFSPELAQNVVAEFRRGSGIVLALDEAVFASAHGGRARSRALF